MDLAPARREESRCGPASLSDRYTRKSLTFCDVCEGDLIGEACSDDCSSSSPRSGTPSGTIARWCSSRRSGHPPLKPRNSSSAAEGPPHTNSYLRSCPPTIIAAGKRTLLIGKAGVGKSTVLREVARLSVDVYKCVVVVVDTISFYRCICVHSKALVSRRSSVVSSPRSCSCTSGSEVRRLHLQLTGEPSESLSLYWSGSR